MLSEGLKPDDSVTRVLGHVGLGAPLAHGRPLLGIFPHDKRSAFAQKVIEEGFVSELMDRHLNRLIFI